MQKLTFSESKVNIFALCKKGKSEFLRIKNVLKINNITFLIRFHSLLERICQTQQNQGLQRGFHNRFALFAFSDTHPQIEIFGGAA